MRAMFQMMNEARISVGLQGSSLANAAYQAALAYCKERLQGSDIRAFKDPDAPRVPIIRHPDVRMMLLRQKAYAEGSRALLIFSAYCMDRERVATDDKDRAVWHGLTEVLTPICKAYCSDMGFRVTEWALQCYGGYGYVKEYPAEQYLRDSKIASIYEGTNGIQAMDLVARKLTMEGGAPLKALIKHVAGFVAKHKDHPVLAAEVAAVSKANDAWMAVNGAFQEAAASGKLIYPLVNASGYLALCGDLLMGLLLVEQAAVAWSKLEPLCRDADIDPKDGKAVAAAAKDNPEILFLDGKIKTARFFCAHELPVATAKSKAIRSGDMSALQIVWEGE
jgi:hypothetical protein